MKAVRAVAAKIGFQEEPVQRVVERTFSLGAVRPVFPALRAIHRDIAATESGDRVSIADHSRFAAARMK